MFRNTNEAYRDRMKDKKDLAIIEYERDYYKNEWAKLMKAQAKPISATEMAADVLSHKDVKIMLTPFIPFDLLQRMLGLIWMSGCWMGLAIMFASWGGLAWTFVCFCMICLSIFFIVSAMFTYLDA